MKLSDFDTKPPQDWDEDKAKKELKEMGQRMAELQYMMRAQAKYSLLIIFQGMDASGKDGAVKSVFKYVSASDIQVKSFKAPSKEELAHDFLWRVQQHSPEKGMIQVFNRSHYEDVLITRVHDWIDDATAEKRFEAINHYETLLLEHNQTYVLKFYLHLSPKEQAKRLAERETNPRKMWKHNPNDKVEASNWESYMKYYQAVFENTAICPWHIIPSDNNDYKVFLISQTIVNKLETLDLAFPLLKH